MTPEQRQTAEQALADAMATRGTRKRTAEQIGVTPSALSHWGVVPSGHVLAVEMATGVRRERLRPDLYPPETIA